MARVIRLEVVFLIQGDLDDATHVVDLLLDAGVFQDPINGHDCDDAGPLRVRSALMGKVEEREATKDELGRWEEDDDG